MKYKVALFLLLLSFLGLQAQEIEYKDFIDDFMTKKLENYNIPGGGAAIIKSGDIVYAQSYGYADVVLDKKVNNNSVYRVASIAKLFTATMVMRLSEQGLIDLDAPVNNYLKNIKVPEIKNHPIRVRDLLSHSEGLTQASIGSKTLNYSELVGMSNYVKKSMPENFIIPGQIISYGNHASAILGVMIEDVTNTQYEQYAKQSIFIPLNMNNSSFYQPVEDTIAVNKLIEYRYRNNTYKPLKTSYSEMTAAGGMHSSLNDLAQFMRIFSDNNSFLSDKTKYLMKHTQFRSHKDLEGTTYGFLEQRYKNHEYLSRFGDSEGAKFAVFIIPDKDISFVVMVNSDEEIIRDTIMQEFFDEFYPTQYEETLYQESVGLNPSGTYFYAQGPKNNILKNMILFTAVKVKRNTDNTIDVIPLGEEPFGKLIKETFYPIKENVYKGMESGQYIAFEQKNNSLYMFSGSGYHGSYIKAHVLQNPLLHKILFLFFACFFCIHALVLLIRKKKTVLYFIYIAHILYLALFFPALMMYNMSPGIPAFAQKANPLLIIISCIPIVTSIIYLIKLKKISKVSILSIIVLAAFFIYVIYWRAIIFYV